jgi:hypothetical protein
MLDQLLQMVAVPEQANPAPVMADLGVLDL